MVGGFFLGLIVAFYGAHLVKGEYPPWAMAAGFVGLGAVVYLNMGPDAEGSRMWVGGGMLVLAFALFLKHISAET